MIFCTVADVIGIEVPNAEAARISENVGVVYFPRTSQGVVVIGDETGGQWKWFFDVGNIKQLAERAVHVTGR